MPDTASQQRIHARTWQARARILGMLIGAADAATDPLDPEAARCRKLAHKISSCGATPVAYWSPDDQRLVVSHGMCKSRLCPTCSARRVRQMQDTIRDLAGELDSPRLMTLTLRASEEPLAEQMKRLRACMKRLRARKDWKRHVTGGVQVIEVTYNARTDRWHPHLHLLLDGTYWPQARLADLWEAITGDSRIVDVRMCHSREAAVRYVAKYVGKTNTPPNLPAKRVGEWADAVHGLRLFQTFGTLHGRLAADPGPEQREPLVHLAPLTPLFEQANDGDPTARQLAADLRALARGADQEDHQRVREALTAWWQSFLADRSGSPPPPAPATPPPKCRDPELFTAEQCPNTATWPD